MAIAFKGNRVIAPTHPGEMLREDFIPDYGLTVAGLASALGVDLWNAARHLDKEIRRIKPLNAA